MEDIIAAARGGRGIDADHLRPAGAAPAADGGGPQGGPNFEPADLAHTALATAEAAKQLASGMAYLIRTIPAASERASMPHSSGCSTGGLGEHAAPMGRARFMALEMGHFCEQWHPVAPSSAEVLVADGPQAARSDGHTVALG